jgi:hypothetical protein
MVEECLNSLFDRVELTLCERVSFPVEISWQLESVHRALLEWRLTEENQVPCDGAAVKEIWYRIFEQHTTVY